VADEQASILRNNPVPTPVPCRRAGERIVSNSRLGRSDLFFLTGMQDKEKRPRLRLVATDG
jgi:hypothetical protein